MGARLTKSLLHNDNAGGNRKHRDHRTHRVANFPKKRHDKIWRGKREEKYRKREQYEMVGESLEAMTSA